MKRLFTIAGYACIIGFHAMFHAMDHEHCGRSKPEGSASQQEQAQQKEQLIRIPYGWGLRIYGGTNINNLPDNDALTVLELNNIDLKRLDLNAIAQKVGSISKLFINNCNLEQVMWPTGNMLPYLKTLDLHQNNLTEVDFGKLVEGLRFANLETIDLSHNKIQSAIVSSNPVRRSRLKTINLSHNILAHLPGNLFAAFVGLQQLLLNSNNIRVIDKSNKLYVPVDSGSVDLSSNAIEYIDPQSIEVNTKKIDVRECYPRCVRIDNNRDGPWYKTFIELTDNKLALGNELALLKMAKKKYIDLQGLDKQHLDNQQ